MRARVVALARNIVKYRLLRDVDIRSDRFGREHMVELAARYVRINDVRGDYLEFGVFRGSTFAQFHHVLRRHGIDMRMFAFDSFAGLPDPQGVDADPGFRRYRRGQFSCAEDDFVEALRRRWVPPDAYTIVPGYFSESLRPDLYTKYDLRAGLVWVDSLFYESARAVLEFVAPILEDGALLMFNSWFRFKARPDAGERRAVAEFLEACPHLGITEYARFGSAGLALIVHRPAAVR